MNNELNVCTDEQSSNIRILGFLITTHIYIIIYIYINSCKIKKKSLDFFAYTQHMTWRAMARVLSVEVHNFSLTTT